MCAYNYCSQVRQGIAILWFFMPWVGITMVLKKTVQNENWNKLLLYRMLCDLIFHILDSGSQFLTIFSLKIQRGRAIPVTNTDRSIEESLIATSSQCHRVTNKPNLSTCCTKRAEKSGLFKCNSYLRISLWSKNDNKPQLFTYHLTNGTIIGWVDFQLWCKLAQAKNV